MSHHADCGVSAEQALEKLKAGNAAYLKASANPGDISPAIRLKTCKEGQAPYAVVITCSDSRVIPEAIFSAGIGELFVIRVAGNVIDKHQLGSVEYAKDHCGSHLILVLGHDHCGAVGASMGPDPGGNVSSITQIIQKAIGGETDDYKASCLNAKNSAEQIKAAITDENVLIKAAVYRIETGEVEFLD